MPVTYRSKYGLDWPHEVADPFIDLIMAKRWREEPYLGSDRTDPGDHLLRAIRALYAPSVWGISPWTEEHAHGWCEESSLGLIGNAASSKSWDIGGFAMLDWLTDPGETVTIMASTSKLALADRTFASSIKLFKDLKQHPRYQIPGHIAKSVMAIMLGDDETANMPSNDKTALRGVALAQGTADDARGSLQGRHAPYVRLIADELAAMKDPLAQAVVDARTNLSIGAEKDFKFCFLANPESKLDVCGRLATPVDGWDSVDETVPRWRTRGGLVIHHNGFQSPAITEPDGATKYPYLIRQSQIDAILEEEGGNANSRQVWTMIYGFPCPQGSSNTVLNQADIATFKPCDPPTSDLSRPAPHNNPVPSNPGPFHPPQSQFTSPRKRRFAALDPAFTAMGDNCAFAWGELDLDATPDPTLNPPDQLPPTTLLNLAPIEILPIDASSDEPAAYQVVRQAVQRCRELGIPLTDIAIDDSGTQSVAGIWQVETGRTPVAYNYSSRSSDPHEYSNLVTEMWYKVQQWVRASRIRGLDGKAAEQFCNREFKKLKPRQLESKVDYKSRLRGKSPDEADAVAMLVLLASTYATEPFAMEVAPWAGETQLQFSLDFDGGMYDTTDSIDSVVGNY